MNIDRIARGMVDVEPSVDLEARIRARVRATPSDRPAAWWTWRVAVPVGAVAIVALATALIVGVPGTRSPEVVNSVVVPETRSPGVVPTSQVPNIPSSQLARIRTSQLLTIRTSQLPKIPTSQLSDAELAWMDRRIPALDPVNGLQMDRLRMDSIQPEPLAITPLTIAPVGTDGAGIERRNDR